MEQLVLIKLGGSVITHKDEPLKADVAAILRLGKEIAEARKKLKAKIIIGHGSGSFGHSLASKYRTHEGVVNKGSLKGAVLVEDVVVRLNRIVTKSLLSVNLPVFSFAPASFLTSKGRKARKVFPEAIFQALKREMIPLVYGDVVLDEKIGFTIFSTEMVFEALIKHLFGSYKIVKIIHASDTNGVYGPDGRTIPIITMESFGKLRSAILGSKVADVTGGMLHKVEEGLKLSKDFGVEAVVINGRQKGVLTKAILDSEINGGTVIRSF